ncbi:MAG: translation initiation factor IF-2 [Bacteroidia bacterium]|nr:translation initiation factor IF-2 [Bacteroidia bacterium]
MTDQKKTRLYKVAKEFNLSHDTLIDFLIKKGCDVKNHMSIIDDPMMELIERHYKKEKVDAERHARKRKEFDEIDKRRRGEDQLSEDGEILVGAEPPTVPDAEVEPILAEEVATEVAEPPAEQTTPVEQVPEVEEPAVEHVDVEHLPSQPIEAETPPVVVVEEVPPVVVEEAQEVEAAVADTVSEEVTEAPVAAPEAEKQPEVKKKAKTEEIDLSIEAAVPKMRGLTVMGKIDLNAAAAAAERKKDTKPGASTGDAADDDKPKRKKKKKKKELPGAKPATEESLDKKLARKGGKRGPKPKEVDQAEVASAIKKTIASMSDFGATSQRSALRKRKRARREEEQLREIEMQEREKKILRIYEYATVSEIASLMNVGVSQVIQALIGLGVMASINQRLELEIIEMVAAEFGFELQPHEEFVEEEFVEEEDDEDTLLPRPPIVTIMGHVDHGKTKLLDFIRKTNVVAGESGGITQHIGAYTVTLESGRKITFLDTPGHEAFTAMRARGAQVTDIVVLVVAADDSVMPQTVEAISHAQAAKVPIVVALNKIDKPEANQDKVKQQLADRGILVEEWGGKYGCVPISAKEGINIEDLLERILLEADIMEYKANPDREARGTVIEAELDKGKGIIATVLVQKGTLRVGDSFVAGNEFGKVRAMMDERGKRVEEASPAMPVQVLGFNGAPQAGDAFYVVEGERKAREISTNRQQIKRESDFRRVRRKTLDDISEQIKLGGVQDLPIVVKGDVDGSVEALSDSLLKLSTGEVRIDVIHKGVGAISESDVLLASASNAIIIGFRVRPNLNARKLAESEDVDIRMYDIIYDAIEDVRDALEGMLRPEIKEKINATVLVREVFRISRVGAIAGCYVQDGKINRNARVRLLRDGIVIFTGGISSLKRFKDDVRDVDTGFECGISLDGFNDIKIGDVIESYEQVEVKRSLEQAQ